MNSASPTPFLLLVLTSLPFIGATIIFIIFAAVWFIAQARGGLLNAARWTAIFSVVPLIAGALFARLVLAFTCFDSCPQDIPSAVASRLALIMAPMLLPCAVSWVLSLVVLARAGRRRRFAWLLVLPVLAFVVAGVSLWLGVILGGTGSPEQTFNSPEHTLSMFSEVFLFVATPVLACWPVGSYWATTGMVSRSGTSGGAPSLSWVPLLTVGVVALGLLVPLMAQNGLSYFTAYLPLGPASLEALTYFFILGTVVLGIWEAASRRQWGWLGAFAGLGSLVTIARIVPNYLVYVLYSHPRGIMVAYESLSILWYLSALGLCVAVWWYLRRPAQQEPSGLAGTLA